MVTHNTRNKIQCALTTKKIRIGRKSVDIDGSHEPPLLPLPIRMLYLFSYLTSSYVRNDFTFLNKILFKNQISVIWARDIHNVY